MALNLREILGRLRTRATDSKLKRRKALDDAAWTHFPRLRTLLLVVGYVWMLLLPLKELSRETYIDENALQPGGVRSINFLFTAVSHSFVHQVHTNWNWGDVHRADLYLAELERLRDNNATCAE